MKTQKYLVIIEMPDGDMIGPGWIRDIIQTDCDVEDAGRQKVSVIEIKDTDGDLEDTATGYAEIVDKEADYNGEWLNVDDIAKAFKDGAEWMATQGILRECVVEEGEDIGFSMANPFNEGDSVIIQIRKK